MEHQFLVNADDVNVLGGSAHTIKKNAEALVAVSEENGLEVNGDTTDYMVMSRYQDAGRSHSKKTDNSSFEGVKEFIYLGTSIKTPWPLSASDKHNKSKFHS